MIHHVPDTPHYFLSTPFPGGTTVYLVAQARDLSDILIHFMSTLHSNGRDLFETSSVIVFLPALNVAPQESLNFLT